MHQQNSLSYKKQVKNIFNEIVTMHQIMIRKILYIILNKEDYSHKIYYLRTNCIKNNLFSIIIINWMYMMQFQKIEDNKIMIHIIFINKVLIPNIHIYIINQCLIQQ
jgi:hypothetical protein